MKTSISERFSAGFGALLKGGPGSGNWGHAGRPGKVGGSLSGGGASLREQGSAVSGMKTSVGRLDKFVTARFRLKAGYDALKPEQKVEVLKAAVSSFDKGGSQYVSVKHPFAAGMSAEVKAANAAIGANEAIRRVTLEKLQAATDPTEQRKLLHAAVKLQELTQRAVGVRQDEIVRHMAGPEVRKPSSPPKDVMTPEGTLRQAAYDQLPKLAKTDVLLKATGTYRSVYKPVAKLPEGASQKAIDANRMVGAYEGVRSAIGSKLGQVEAGSTEERKILHAALNLQRDARRFARIRDLELGKE